MTEDGGSDAVGHAVRFYSEYLRHGGEEELGLPISRPFRVGARLFQAFECGVLEWRPDLNAAAIVDSLDVLHSAGRDPELQRFGVPPAQPPSAMWLTDASLQAAYTSVASVPYDLSGSLSRSPLDGSWVERLKVGELLRSTGRIPSAATWIRARPSTVRCRTSRPRGATRWRSIPTNAGPRIPTTGRWRASSRPCSRSCSRPAGTPAASR